MKIERYGNLVCPMPYADTQGNQIRPAIRERLDNVVEKAFNIKKNIFIPTLAMANRNLPIY